MTGGDTIVSALAARFRPRHLQTLSTPSGSIAFLWMSSFTEDLTRGRCNKRDRHCMWTSKHKHTCGRL